MATKLAGLRLAPPTRPPSISGAAMKPAKFSGVMLPPYRSRSYRAAAAPYRSATSARSSPITALATSGVAGRPVPIAHTGS